MTNKMRLTSMIALFFICLTLVACGGGSGGGSTSSPGLTAEPENTEAQQPEPQSAPGSQMNGSMSVKALTTLSSTGIEQYPSVMSSPNGQYVLAAWTQANQVVIKPNPMLENGPYFSTPIRANRYVDDSIALALNDNGFAIVSWVEWGNGEYPQILYRTIDIPLGTVSDVNEVNPDLTNITDQINLTINSNGDALLTFRGATVGGAGVLASVFSRASNSWSGLQVLYNRDANIFGQTLDNAGRAVVGFEYFKAKYATYQQASGWDVVKDIPFDIERESEATVNLNVGNKPTLAFVKNNGATVADQGVSISVFDWPSLTWLTTELVGDTAYKIHNPTVTAGADGKLYLTWLADIAGIAENKIYIAQRDSNGWNKASLVTDEPGGSVKNIVVKVDGQGNYSIMWTNAVNQYRGLKLASLKANSIRITTFTDASRGVVDFAQALLPSGERYVVWSEANTRESLVFIRKDNLN